MKATEQIETLTGRISLRAGLKLLRQWCGEVGNYHSSRPMISIATGDGLQPQLEKSENGSELLGCWQIVRYSASGEKLAVYKV